MMRDFRADAWKAFDELPDDVFGKVKGELKHGGRVYWYYKGDVEFAKEYKTTARKQEPYSGFVLAMEDVDVPNNDLAYEDALIVMDRYPTEKCGCEATYFPLTELLMQEDLVEVYSK